MKIVFASKNRKKILELQRIADGKIEFLCLTDIKKAENIAQVEENGFSFIENARIKAKYWANILKMPSIAEDSGIEIDALNGEPGVYTKRCIKKYCNCKDIDEDKPSELYPKILEAMRKSGNDSKKAHWISSMVLAFPDNDKTIETMEILDGDMCECRGIREFGFDQYFIPKTCNKTLSEMLPEVKDQVGPRLKAFEKLFDLLINNDKCF